MNVLITGGTGYIGSHVALALSQAGHSVVLLDNLRHSHPLVATRLQHLSGQPMPLEVGDVRDTALVSRALLHHDIDAVVHCAGLKGRQACAKNPLDAYAHNLQGTLSVLQAMAIYNTPMLVFTSSAEVYGEPFYRLQDERHPTQPTTALGRSLLQAENLIADAVATHATGWRVAVLRCFHPAGAHESGLVSDSTGLPATAEGLLPKLARVAAGEAHCLALYPHYEETPDGTALRGFTHVDDIAQGHLRALTYLASHPGRHLFNLGHGQPVSVLQTLRAFEAASGQPVHWTPALRDPDDVACSAANALRAKNQLGWEAQRGLADICESSWNHMLTQKMLNASAPTRSSL
ncbi:UDP-glucose 4-epimerase GalE [Hydrogenophaga sp.]|uniref:UDP-glucose 4-epimerase GalE n=1 Tax=Hydrogenophaga sp. TaxID=1904254 RepID=UPI003F6C3590